MSSLAVVASHSFVDRMTPSGVIRKNAILSHFQEGDEIKKALNPYRMSIEDFNRFQDDVETKGDIEAFYFLLDLQKSLITDPLNVGYYIIPPLMIEKAKQSASVGEERTWGGKRYIKTQNGWRPKGKGKQAATEESDRTDAPAQDSGSKRGDKKLSPEMERIANGQLSNKEKIVKLAEMGASKAAIANALGVHYSSVYTTLQTHASRKQIETRRKESEEPKTEEEKQAHAEKESRNSEIDEEIKTISVDDRWNAYETFAEMVIDGERKSLIAFGTGGVGKTFTIQRILANTISPSTGKKGMVAFDEEKNIPALAVQPQRRSSKDDDVDEDEDDLDDDSLEDDEGTDFSDKSPKYDYVKITGKVSTTGLWRKLYEHNGKTIIFDDCDSVLDSDDGINILKGALDSTGDGTIEYDSAKSITTSWDATQKIPKRFKFTGRVIFISNRPASEWNDPKGLAPIKSRSLKVDLSMSPEQTIERIRQILPKMKFEDPEGKPIEVTSGDKEAAVDFLERYKDHIDISNMNARTLGSIALIKRRIEKRNEMNADDKDYKKKDWKREAMIQLFDSPVQSSKR